MLYILKSLALQMSFFTRIDRTIFRLDGGFFGKNKERKKKGDNKEERKSAGSLKLHPFNIEQGVCSTRSLCKCWMYKTKYISS